MSPDSTMESAKNQILAGLEAVHEHWGYFLASGIAFLVLGTIALTYTVLTTLASVFVFGVAFLIGGMFQTVHAFKASTSKWSGFLLDLLIGVLYVITGLLMEVHPLAGAQSLTLLLAAFFLVVGVFRTMGAMILRPPSWGWLLVSGIVTFLLGILVWAQWPESALWLIGTLVAIDMIFNGAWLAMLALNVHRMTPQEIQERATAALPRALFEQQPTRQSG
ncbi:MAG: hypothetical protein OJF51_002713 [Nitrospira sp.]|nr:MAG: hypothetical protein OJF51_002713 [Nitrospira sp.]